MSEKLTFVGKIVKVLLPPLTPITSRSRTKFIGPGVSICGDPVSLLVQSGLTPTQPSRLVISPRQVDLGTWYTELKETVYVLVELNRDPQQLTPHAIAELKDKVDRIRGEAKAVQDALAVSNEIFAIFDNMIAKVTNGD